jgi:hypothetical protein
MIKNKEVKYVFYQYQADSINTAFFTLVLNNPASIKFVCTGPSGVARALINNIYYLDSLAGFTLGTSNYPFELILNNNINEVDTTSYTIVLKPQTTLSVVCKYYN